MAKIEKANKYIIGLYFLIFLILIILAWSNEGPRIIYLVFITYYAFTGSLFGFFEAFVFLRRYLKSKKRIFILWMIVALLYAAGSIFLSFFSGFVL